MVLQINKYKNIESKSFLTLNFLNCILLNYN